MIIVLHSFRNGIACLLHDITIILNLYWNPDIMYRAGEHMGPTAILLDMFQQHFQKQTPLVKENVVT